ncbi:hypothetical protein M5K25_019658 [Dendrobium thyrsiflorum]|uniref:Formamidase n=1 Tax=Dendrobium thyrsiflorum TaxID=117978 RepID=A0ABD0UG60_DENTH
MAAKKADALEERLKRKIEQIKSNVEKKLSTMEGRFTSLENRLGGVEEMLRKLMEMQFETPLEYISISALGASYLSLASKLISSVIAWLRKFTASIHQWSAVFTTDSLFFLIVYHTRCNPLVHAHRRSVQAIPFAINDGTPEWEKIANEAARTIPGRENGGNCDIKNLSRGSKIYLPVFVEGANLSTGDMHFSQGDGEVSFCGAIEMSGFLELKCEIIRGGMKEYLSPMGPTELHVNPIFEIGPVEPRFSEWLVFEGISVDESGRQHFMDATLAYKRAVLNAIDYLSKFGYSKEQAYLLLSCCPCEGRISGIVDTPNAVATIAIPIAIFDQDIRPKPQRSLGGPRIVKKLPDVFRCSYDGDLPITPHLSKAKEN